jgi:hypothetical protein
MGFDLINLPIPFKSHSKLERDYGYIKMATSDIEKIYWKINL